MTRKHDQRVADLIAATGPLLDFWATADAVFDEDDAMSPEKRQAGMARIYRAWKDVRRTLDPDFNVAREERKVAALKKEKNTESKVHKWQPTAKPSPEKGKKKKSKRKPSEG